MELFRHYRRRGDDRDLDQYFWERQVWLLHVKVRNKTRDDTDDDVREEATRRAVNIFKESNNEEFTEVRIRKEIISS